MPTPPRLARALFIDRDNTLVADPGYLHRPEDVRLLPGAADLLRRAAEQGYLRIVVTNQAGIGRGTFTEADFHAVNARMAELLAANGTQVDAIDHCPHPPEAGCDCRKPRPGMIFRQAERWQIDLDQSWMIGDKALDVQAGLAAGCRAVWVTALPDERQLSPAERAQTLIVPDLPTLLADPLWPPIDEGPPTGGPAPTAISLRPPT